MQEVISNQAMSLSKLNMKTFNQGVKLCRVIENAKTKHSSLKNEHKRVVSRIQKTQNDYCRMERENKEVSKAAKVFKDQFETLAKKIDILQRENADYRKKLMCTWKDESIAYLNPHDLHIKIRTLDNKSKLL